MSFLRFDSVNPNTETNITIRTTKRFRAWFVRRGEQENMTVSALRMAILQAWADNGAAVMTPGLTIQQVTRWNPEIAWESLVDAEKTPKAPKRATSQPFHKRR